MLVRHDRLLNYVILFYTLRGRFPTPVEVARYFAPPSLKLRRAT